MDTTDYTARAATRTVRDDDSPFPHLGPPDAGHLAEHHPLPGGADLLLDQAS